MFSSVWPVTHRFSSGCGILERITGLRCGCPSCRHVSTAFWALPLSHHRCSARCVWGRHCASWMRARYARSALLLRSSRSVSSRCVCTHAPTTEPTTWCSTWRSSSRVAMACSGSTTSPFSSVLHTPAARSR